MRLDLWTGFVFCSIFSVGREEYKKKINPATCELFFFFDRSMEELCQSMI